MTGVGARQEIPGMRDHVQGKRLMHQTAPEWLVAKAERDQKLTGCPPDLWLIHGVCVCVCVCV